MADSIPYLSYAPPWARESGSLLLCDELTKQVVSLGVLKEIRLGPVYDNFPRSYFLASEMDRGESDALKSACVGQALDTNPERAYRRALFEGLERAFVSKFSLGPLPRAAAGSVENPVSIQEFSRWSQDQLRKYKDRNWDSSTVFHWTSAVRLRDRSSCSVPAQLVFWAYPYGSTAEPILREGNTSGAAAHTSVEEALRAAVYELIERDAALTSWLRGAAPYRVRHETISDTACGTLIEESRKHKLEPHLLVLLPPQLPATVPAVACVLEDLEGRFPVIAVGTKAGASYEECIAGAILESWSVNQATRYAVATSSRKKLRLRLWGEPRMRKYMHHFLSGERVAASDFSLGTCTLEELIERYDIHWWTSPDESLKNMGVTVGKAISPVLVPLYLQEDMIQLAHPGLEVSNVVPHPFP